MLRRSGFLALLVLGCAGLVTPASARERAGGAGRVRAGQAGGRQTACQARGEAGGQARRSPGAGGAGGAAHPRGGVAAGL